ncbi:peptidoglycan DD-metalloendopeptidase family protein [Staphylococcus hyicus]|uniref:lysostaphin n=1 Tax=Staphylococcus hyicus TaxID=1284 RepID=A0A418JKW9_STAHY|nr:M23 family metallopeptidase [Staphylococcus hyicus]MDP4448535.1 M23 family metallopeptidase [Staphylococcus hyicus]MDY3697599.1 M23 family metallopeptidase [Staphylococcus hyicus]NJH80388.1 peptidoglycan DD-metalloendopeptidase family protein [Staphylococcus hyicus]NJH99358.1 peptidoglycan DD-metalloendopeptidase family protein [Staphylococcus hyicus]NJI30515.1 peptidoglycan DD-metalloendopeptidase family protein [Staphylococcus hyicus]
MKKVTAATIATIGFATFGLMHGDAEASEGIQPSAYTTTFSEETNDYITIDAHGNYHHTIDGNWNVSMFEQGLYQSSYIDANGHMHYVYYTQTFQNDNSDTPSQSHEAIQAQYRNDQSQYDASQTYTQSRGDWHVNETDQTGNGTKVGRAASYGMSQQQSGGNAQQNHDSKSNTSQAASGWLKKYPKWQPYGQYTTGGAHYGVDYGMPENTPVYSFTDGKVIDSGWSNYGGGNQITIQEANSNYYQWYMHMNQLNVQAGDTVKKGQQIGLSGNTGNSTGPHLHFQRMSGGIGNQYAVNPDNYLANQ